MKKAIYPGSFDPFTNGHLDIVERSLRVVDHLTIAVLKNTSKKNLLEPEKRVELIREVFEGNDKISVETFSGLLVDFMKEKNTNTVIRGLRAVSDFDYEHAVFLMNNRLLSEFETIFFMARADNSFISSSIVKEVSSLGGNIADQVPAVVYRHLKKIYGHD